MTRLSKAVLWLAVGAACLVHGISVRESVAAPLGSDFNGTIYDVDLATGATSNPRGGPLFGLAGITCGSPDGTLYGVTASLTGGSQLVTIDAATGASTIVGPTGLSGVIEGDLDFDPTSVTLYGILGTGNTLFTLNTTTGAATIVGPLNYTGIADPSAMAFDSVGTFYVLDGTTGVLAKINPTNAATISVVTLSPPLPVHTLAGMDFDPATGVLYVGIGFASGGANALYTLDVATGAMVQIGPTGADISGLAFCGSCLLSSDFVYGAIQNVNQFTGAQTSSRGGPTVSLSGITYSAATGNLYGVTASLSSTSKLVTIDPATGVSTVIGSTGLTQLFEGDLDVDPTTGTLYGMYGGSGNTLLTFNTTTGAASVVGPLSGSLDPSAMAFDAGGNLYVLEGTAGTLKRINKLNATTISTVTLSQSFPIHTLEGMDFDPATGVLYVGIGMAVGGANALYTLDPVTGTLTTIGPTGEISGLTFAPASMCVPPAPLHHFTCYKGRPSNNTVPVTIANPPGLALADQFGSSTVEMKKMQLLCAPTDKLGEDPGAPLYPEHLMGYPVKSNVNPPLPTHIKVTDQFNPGGLFVDARKRSHLLVPSVKSLTGPPPYPPAFQTDHFQCYKVRGTPDTPQFVPVNGVTLEDQFGLQTVKVKKPAFLCAPVDKNGEDPTAPGHVPHLMCYLIKRIGAPFPPVLNASIRNQFGFQLVDAKKPALLCVPALKTL